MTTASALRCDIGTAARAGPRLQETTGFCLLAGLAGLVAGCGILVAPEPSPVAPVHSPLESSIPGRMREYIVSRGDTVYSIAWRHGVDYRALAETNSIRDPFTIFPGQRLLIPESGNTVSPPPEPSAAASDSAVPGDVSTYGTGAQAAPVLEPLPPSSPEPKPSMDRPREAPPEVAAQQPPSVSGPAADAPLAARMAAGLSWMRPTRGRTIGSFGRGGNKGIDIAGAFEQPIHAAAGGRVVYAGSGLIGYGKLVIVKHDARFLSAYAHNERLHVREGDEVKGGQHIADMGRSSQGRVMLHFEIRRDGRPVDPLRFLP